MKDYREPIRDISRPGADGHRTHGGGLPLDPPGHAERIAAHARRVQEEVKRLDITKERKSS